MSATTSTDSAAAVQRSPKCGWQGAAQQGWRTFEDLAQLGECRGRAGGQRERERQGRVDAALLLQLDGQHSEQPAEQRAVEQRVEAALRVCRV